MKTILICPNQASGLTVMADSRPLATLPILGEAFICYWMHHLAAAKYKEVRIVTGDSVDLLADYTGDGSRWGMKVEIFHEVRELTLEEARAKYKLANESDWASEPLDVIEADHLPGLPDQLPFTDPQSWFKTMIACLPMVTSSKRIGMREVTPGVWVGRRSKIARTAKLVGPCWIGEHVQIGKNAVIGPNSFLEHEVVIDDGSHIRDSWIGPETFLGSLTELKESLAWGNLLINWRTGSHILVPDAFLLASLSEGKEKEESRTATRSSEVPQGALARRIGNVISFAQKLQS